MFMSKHFKAKNLSTSIQFSFPYRKVWINIFVILFNMIVILLIFLPNLTNLRINPSIFSEIASSSNTVISIIVVITFLFLVVAFLLIELLWLLKGEEVIEVAEDHISIRHQILGLGFSKKIQADKIDFVFVSRQKFDFVDDLLSIRQIRFLNFRKGKIAVNSGKIFLGGINTFRFGSVLNDIEAKQIITIIHSKFPQYQSGKSKAG